jgi:hypothetical protein
MGNVKTNVTTGKPKTGGAVYRAPLSSGLQLPTTADGSLASAFVCLGYCSDSGLSNDNSRSVDQVKAWGGDIVLTPQSEKTDTFSLTLIETLNADVLKVVHGETNVTGALSTGLSISVNDKELEPGAWVIDMIMTNNVLKRIVIPDGRVTEVGSVSYTDSDAIGYEITITAVPDSSGNSHYEYIKGPVGATGATS